MRNPNLLQEFLLFVNTLFDLNSDIPAHISKLECITFCLKALDKDIDDGAVMSKLLSILPEK